MSPSSCNDVVGHPVRPAGQQQSDSGHRSDENHKGHREERGRKDDLLPEESTGVSVMECVGQREKNSLKSKSDSIRDLLETRDLTLSTSAAAATTTTAPSSGLGISPVERLLASINYKLETRLRSDARLRRQTDKNQEMMNEWMIAAAVIDRICFIVFGLCFLIGSSVLFFLAISSVGK